MKIHQRLAQLPPYAMLLIVGGLLLMAAASQSNPRVAVLDPDRLRRDSVTIKADLLKASEPARAIQEQLKPKQEELNKATAQYQAQKSVTTAEINSQREAALVKQTKEVQDLTRQLNETLTKAEQENLGPMRERAQKVIEQLARERGIEVVLSASEAIYHATDVDLTDEVIARLDGTAKGGK